MVLSVSRRTDIPCCYPEWFYRRVQEGKVCVRNPFNRNQVSEIQITRDAVDCIVFWTKNPEPMLVGLDGLDGYMYYFQFTLNGYGKDIEPGLPDKRHLIQVFQRVAGRIGCKRVIWRYDPILLNSRYTAQWHISAFEEIAKGIAGCTEKVVVSLVDMYKRTKQNARTLKLLQPSGSETEVLLRELAQIAGLYGMKMETCAESIDLEEHGIGHGSCVDRKLIEELIGCELKAGRAKGQRAGCGCMESLDIGAYNTCKNGCEYCYANYSDALMGVNIGSFEPGSPLLCDVLGGQDRVVVKSVRSWKNPQLRLDI